MQRKIPACPACKAIYYGNMFCALCIHKSSISEDAKEKLLAACYIREAALSGNANAPMTGEEMDKVLVRLNKEARS